MIDIKLQMQCFALLGKTRKLINNWMLEGDKSPGAIESMRLRLERMIKDIDGYLEANDNDTDR